LEQKVVAGYDAAVLEADSATALAHWLAENQYGNRPELGAGVQADRSPDREGTAVRVCPSRPAPLPGGGGADVVSDRAAVLSLSRAGRRRRGGRTAPARASGCRAEDAGNPRRRRQALGGGRGVRRRMARRLRVARRHRPRRGAPGEALADVVPRP